VKNVNNISKIKFVLKNVTIMLLIVMERHAYLAYYTVNITNNMMISNNVSMNVQKKLNSMFMVNVNNNANKIIALIIHNVIVYVHKIIAIIMMKKNV